MKSVVIFDLDGTLTKPALNFDAIRAEIGIESGPILEAMETMTEADRQRAAAILSRHEWLAASNVELYEGAVDVVAECRRRGYRTAVLTRNARAIVDHLVTGNGFVFDAVRTREDGAIKPSAEGVLSICGELGVDPGTSWMVGDYLFDIMSGQAAGTRTVLMVGDGPPPDFAPRADHVICALRELLWILDKG